MNAVCQNPDWTGNQTSVFTTLGARGHSSAERPENDFYATDPKSLEIFLDALKRDGVELSPKIWECACGQGHLSEALINNGYDVISTDLIDRGYLKQLDTLDFLDDDFLEIVEITKDKITRDILTNPPYKYAREFVERALDLVEDNRHVVMFLKIQFLEGQKRRELFDRCPPKYVYVNTSRQLCYLNGDMTQKMSSATCYCWFVWQKGFKGEPVIRWI